MSARVVDARFAGGPVVVDVAEASGRRIVQVDMPGNGAGMFPDEARRFAVALIEQAARAETQEGDWP